MAKFFDYYKLIFKFNFALIKRLYVRLIVISIVTISLIYIHNNYTAFQKYNIFVSATLPGYMGAALGLLLVFRNNSAYEKWWEARKEVGNLVNTVRNMAITINGLLPSDATEKKLLYYKLDAFIFTLKDHLRNSFNPSNIAKLTENEQRLINMAQHKPNVIINLMMEKIENLYLEKKITDIQQSILIDKMHTLIDILGRCERIKNTPIPVSHQILLRFLINIYTLILPFSLIDDLGFLCLPIILFLYYILMSIVKTAEEIEDPFGQDLNDIQMDSIILNIHNNIHELIHFE